MSVHIIIASAAYYEVNDKQKRDGLADGRSFFYFVKVRLDDCRMCAVF